MVNTKFKVGDRVYAPFHGYGTVIKVFTHPSVYPIVVEWDNKEVNSFSENGYLSEWTKTEDSRISIAKESSLIDELGKYRVGDKVYLPFRYGTITAIYGDERLFPIEVTWDEDTHGEKSVTIFAADGYSMVGAQDGVPELAVVERAPEKGEEEMKDNAEEELKIGDWVWLDPNEKGIITFIYPDKDACIVDSELDGEVEAVMAGLTKVDYSPINPSHYQVAGIPEAIDIMKHLMTQEQFKGFLWGNIIKYAYRYGRKGDEHDTAGKIEWYANRLKEVCAEEKKEQERE